jgi:hypothetical protein
MAAGWGAIRKIIPGRLESRDWLRLAALAVLAGLSLFCAFLAHARQPLSTFAEIACACALSLLLAWFLLRNVVFAAVVACGPLPGVFILLAAISVQAAPVGYALALGLVVAVLIGGRLCAAKTSDDGARVARSAARANTQLVVIVVVAFLVPACVAAAHAMPNSAVECCAAAGTLAVVSTGIVVQLGASLPFGGEDYVARANRSREWFARVFAPILPVARPRFGISVFGIACVICAIAFFGRAHLTGSIGLWRIGVFFLLAMASSFAVLRDWRRSLAVLLATAWALQMGIWSVVRTNLAMAPAPLAACLIALVIVFVLQLFVAQDCCGDILTEDDAVAASERAMESRAMTVSVAALTGLAAVLPFDRSAVALCFSVTLAAGAVAAVLFQPAIAIAIESLVPRAATIAARYRLR